MEHIRKVFENLLFIRNYHRNKNRRRFAEVQLYKMLKKYPELGE